MEDTPPDGKPSLPQIAWLIERLAQHLQEGGTFRRLVERLGFGAEAYELLMAAGGVELANVLDWAATIEDLDDSSGGLTQIELITANKDDNDKGPN